jgi:2'-5' RNA ligase
MSSPRLFVAVWPPEDVLDALAALPRPSSPGLRWTNRDQWHVTLRFLGQVESVELVLPALARLDAVCCRAVLGPAVARFGHRVLHVPVNGLGPLAEAVTVVTREVGEPPDPRPYQGHLTLARAQSRTGVDLRPFEGVPIAGEWDVTEVCLVKSQLRPTGARYCILGRTSLR